MIFTASVLAKIFTSDCTFLFSRDTDRVVVMYKGEQIAGYENGLPMVPKNVVESSNALYASRSLEFI